MLMILGAVVALTACGGGGSTPQDTTPNTDTTPPVITITGGTPALEIGGVYTPPTVTATDDVDGDLTAEIVVGGDTVDDGVAGTYTMTYNVTDSSGNKAETKTFTVKISEQVTVDTTPPVITLTGGTTSMTVGGTYTPPTVFATDNSDGDITSQVVKTGHMVNVNVAGTYTETYNVSDSSGNPAKTKTHTVVVNPKNTTTPTTNTAPTWTQSSYDTNLTIRDDTDAPKTIMDLKAVSSDKEKDPITYSITSISDPKPTADHNAWVNSIYIDNGVLKVQNLVKNDPNYDGTVTVTVEATATGGSTNTNINFTFLDFQ